MIRSLILRRAFLGRCPIDGGNVPFMQRTDSYSRVWSSPFFCAYEITACIFFLCHVPVHDKKGGPK